MSYIFSIVIPTFDRAKQLADCLVAIAELDYPKKHFEVLVVDDGSPCEQRDTAEILQDQMNLRFIRKENGGPASARNAGAQEASGQYLVFTDDDCRPAPDWLNNLANQFQQTPNNMLGGRTINRLTENACATTSQLIIDVVYSFFNPDPKDASFFASNNMAMPAEFFRRIGGFDRSFPKAAAEDRDFCDRWRYAGLKMAYTPDAIVNHAHPLTLWKFCRQHFNYGRGARHYHCLRAARGSGRMRDDIKMHAKLPSLLRGPLSELGIVSAAKVTCLLAVWQIANAAGFFYERLRPQKTTLVHAALTEDASNPNESSKDSLEMTTPARARQ